MAGHGHLGVCSPSCFGWFVMMAAALLMVSNVLGLSAATRPEPAAGDQRVSVEFIRSSCGTTRYPHLCFETLSGYAATIRTSPMQLAHAALSVSLDGARSASAAVGKMAAAGMRPREAAAMRDCVENMEDSVEELQRSLREMGELGARGRGEIAFLVSSIQTWVSAALTEEDTCMDGFAGGSMAGGVRAAVRGQIVNVAQLTSNALALINALVFATP